MSLISYESHASVITVKLEGKNIGYIHPRIQRNGDTGYQYVPKGKTAKEGGRVYATVADCQRSLEEGDDLPVDPYQKPDIIWYGECMVLGYDLRTVAHSEAEAKRLLISEHQLWHDHAKTGTHIQTWEELEELTDCRVFEMEIGTVWHP